MDTSATEMRGLLVLMLCCLTVTAAHAACRIQPRTTVPVDVVDGHVLIYIHKEEALDDIERRYPAVQYVLVDDKLRILTAVKKAWGSRVTTVFPRQGQFARDQKSIAAYPSADLTEIGRASCRERVCQYV